MKGRILNVTVWFALRGELRVAFSVSAVVVDGVFLAHPSEPTPLGGVKVTELRLVPPPLALRLPGGVVLLDESQVNRGPNDLAGGNGHSVELTEAHN